MILIVKWLSILNYFIPEVSCAKNKQSILGFVLLVLNIRAAAALYKAVEIFAWVLFVYEGYFDESGGCWRPRHASGRCQLITVSLWVHIYVTSHLRFHGGFKYSTELKATLRCFVVYINRTYFYVWGRSTQ